MIRAAELPDSVHKKLCNGMGPRGGLVFKLLWGLLLVIKIGRYFRIPSNNHDVRCYAGGTEEDRKAVDRAFLREMLDICDKFKGWRYRYARFFALRAYELVDEFGDNVGTFTYRDRALSVIEVIDTVREAG